MLYLDLSIRNYILRSMLDYLYIRSIPKSISNFKSLVYLNLSNWSVDIASIKILTVLIVDNINLVEMYFPTLSNDNSLEIYKFISNSLIYNDRLENFKIVFPTQLLNNKSFLHLNLLKKKKTKLMMIMMKEVYLTVKNRRHFMVTKNNIKNLWILAKNITMKED